ncbi:MAG: 30S ribosomal protein S5 [Planctomycetes bacterium]|nr:30S ribosomal protein S5 [Planctomycetota bacterium]
MATRMSARDLELGEERVVRVNRTAAVVKGGRRFGFSALVIVGDRRGTIGLGQGKAREVPNSIEKAARDAKKNLYRYPLRGDTIPHLVIGKYRSSRVILRPAAPGTGIKAGATVRAVVEELGIRNILTKAMGSRNPLNLAKATLDGLNQLRSKETIFTLRGLPVLADRDRPKLEPTGLDKEERARKQRDARRGGKPERGGRGGGGRGRRGRGEEEGGDSAGATGTTETPDAPAAE